MRFHENVVNPFSQQLNAAFRHTFPLHNHIFGRYETQSPPRGPSFQPAPIYGPPSPSYGQPPFEPSNYPPPSNPFNPTNRPSNGNNVFGPPEYQPSSNSFLPPRGPQFPSIFGTQPPIYGPSGPAFGPQTTTATFISNTFPTDGPGNPHNIYGPPTYQPPAPIYGYPPRPQSQSGKIQTHI